MIRTKEYLNRIRHLKFQVELRKKQLNYLNDTIVKTSETQELQNSINEELLKVEIEKEKLINEILSLGDPLCEEFLILRFVEQMKISEIAEVMGYSLRNVYIIEAKALKLFQEYLDRENKSHPPKK